MSMKKLSILLSLFLVLYLYPQSNTTILISLDGFRWDYLNRGVTPTMDSLRSAGVSALSLKPTFPSKTFPNHYSIITGLYPENHGIISNFMTDPFTNKKYSLGDSVSVRDDYWYKGEPFWETAQRQGIICAAFFWPGSEVLLEYKRPRYYKPYEHTLPYSDRVKGVLEWLDLPDSIRPSFIALYFDAADTYGHKFGPASKEVNLAVSGLDSIISMLVHGLVRRNLFSNTNLIIVSDHGMTQTDSSKLINIDSILMGLSYIVDGEGPISMVNGKGSNAQDIIQRLNQNANNFRAYLRNDVPDYFHFSNNPLIGDIIIIAEPGYTIVTNKSLSRGKKYYNGGNHGYDNNLSDMHGIFIAHGPSFKLNYKTGTLRNIDIYPLLCKIFDIIPSGTIDGDLNEIEFVLR